jgi:hypothetical protein
MAGPDLGKMIGPLPLGAWAAVLAGGLGIALYTRRNSAAAADTTVDPNGVGVDPNVGAGGSGQWANIDTPVITDVGGAAPPTTNEEWASQATDFLLKSGYPAVAADQAIRRYVANEQLSASEAVMVGVALAKLGALPVPLPPVPGGTVTPPPTTPPVNTLYRYHTVLITENFPMIALKEKISLPALWQGNSNLVRRLDGTPGILSSYALHHGQRLVIPTTKKYNNGFLK